MGKSPKLQAAEQWKRDLINSRDKLRKAKERLESSKDLLKKSIPKI